MKIITNNPQVLKLAARWRALSASEQKTLSWGAAILLPALIYALLWQPAFNAVGKLQKNLPPLRAQLAQMKIQSDEFQTLRQHAQPAVLDGASLKKIVQNAATQQGWAAPAFVLELTEQNDVRFIAESVVFPRLLTFLRDLDATHHIRVGTISVSPSSAQGVVKISGTLTSGAEQ